MGIVITLLAKPPFCSKKTQEKFVELNCFVYIIIILNLSKSFKVSIASFLLITSFDHNKGCVHCEKCLFVLASRQKIPGLRTENPAVDTRKICQLPDTAGKTRPSGPWRETFYIPMPEKLSAENPSKQLQILLENPEASNSRNGRKIPAINYRYGRKIPSSKNRYSRKILQPVTKETARKFYYKCHSALKVRMQWRSVRVSGL
jgi:hypothetical protein